MTATRAAETYLSDLSPKDKPWDKHRHQSDVVKRHYSKGGFERYAERIRDCSRRLSFAFQHCGEDGVVLKLHAARFCRVRFCPTCQWRRAMMWRARFFKSIPEYLSAHPDLVPVFLTLTVQNMPVEQLRESVVHLNSAFARLTKRKAWPGEGWVRSLEVTRSDNGEAHPHLHVLMFVKPGYFSKNYIKQATWRELWQSCLRVDYLPVVNVKRVRGKDASTGDGDIRIAILETLKYGVKPDDLERHAGWLYAITEQLHKTRAVAIGGNLKDFLREEEPEDLIHDGDEEEQDMTEQDYPYLLFDWKAVVRRYAKAEDQDGKN